MSEKTEMKKADILRRGAWDDDGRGVYSAR